MRSAEAFGMHLNVPAGNFECVRIARDIDG